MKRLLIVLTVATVFMANSASAAKRQVYFSINGGASFTSDAEIPGLNISFSPGYNVGGAVGVDMGEFRVEGEIAYRSNSVDKVNGISFPVSADLSALSFMGNGYYDIEMNSALTPYIGAGIGIADNELDVSTVGSESEVNFTYQFMVGLGFDISQKIVLTGGYRYFGIADGELPNTHEFVFGARFKF